jgi:glutathione S-transferase
MMGPTYQSGVLMKLYYKSGACSLAPHILLVEAGLGYELVAVDLGTKKLENGEDFKKINIKGSVPTLALNDGEILTETAVILKFIAEQAPQKNLLPVPGTLAHYRCLEWLNYIATEMHKGIGLFFAAPRLLKTDEAKAELKEGVTSFVSRSFDYLNSQLEGKDYLMGSEFSAPDAYLYTTLRWTRGTGPDLKSWPNITRFMETVGAREGVKKALSEEGLK